jgi:dynein heavy chain
MTAYLKLFQIRFNGGFLFTGHEVEIEISPSLKSFLRPCYAMYPETRTICCGMLCAAGFTESKILSLKLDYFISVADNMFCAYSLSWGIQTIKSILERAVALLIACPEERECCLIGQALLEFVLPRVKETCSGWLLQIVSDVFGVESRIALSASEAFINAFHDACAVLGLKTEEALVSAAIRLKDLMVFRHSLFVLGKAGTGKSTLWKIIAKIQEISMGQVVAVHDVFPKVLTIQEFYGGINSDCEWRDGLLTKIVRSLSSQDSYPQWLVLDGMVSHDWIELMQTMIGESKSLLLPNGENIVIDQRTYLIFEAADLKHASPSSLSSSGVTHVQDTSLWMLARSR